MQHTQTIIAALVAVMLASCLPEKTDNTVVVDPACPSDQPYCLDGKCVDCGALDCSEIFPLLPLCDQRAGLCVSCAPEPTQCDAHSQCQDSACDFDIGVCMPSDTTLWVGGVGCDDNGDGSQETPLCGLDEAFERVKDGAATSVALRVKGDAYKIAGSLHVPAERVVALVVADDLESGTPISIASPTSPTIIVDAQGRLLLDGVLIEQSSGDGIGCTQGVMWLDRLTIAGSANRGVSLTGCTATMRRSVLVANQIAGMQAIGGKLRVENSFISSNGTFDATGGGIYLSAGASLDAVYLTMFDNIAAAGNPFSVACDADPEKETVTVRNSLAINKGGNTMCDDATIQTSAWSDPVPGTTNMTMTFVGSEQYLAEDPVSDGVYRPIAGTVLGSLATRKNGDPLVDFDGDARPEAESASDYAGADRPAL